MADFPIDDGGRYEVDGKVNAGSTGTTLTAGAIDTKGAWVTLTATTAFDAIGLLVHLMNQSSLNYSLDIGLGAAAAETVIIPDIVVKFATTATQYSFFFPVCIPAGSRVAARVASAVASATLVVMVHPIAVGLMPASPLQRATNYGFVVVGTKATLIDPGGTADTKGAWAVLSASTANPIRSAVLLFSSAETTLVASNWEVDIGYGAAASETILIPDLPVRTITRYTAFPTGPIPLAIPAGSRLVARAQSPQITAGSRELALAIMGVD